MVRAIALDPGKTTGVAYVEWGDDRPLRILWTERIPDGPEGFMLWWLHDLLARIESLDLIICELFDIDGTVTGTWSPRIEGALMALWSGPIVWQRRDEKASLLPDGKRRGGWFKERGVTFRTTHEMDAATHALVYVGKRLNHLPTVRAWWPPKPDGA